MTDTAIRLFFGDSEKQFLLKPELISELERSTSVGIGALARRVFTGQYAHKDLIEIIRLGLIGGGTTPERAAELIAAYAAVRPIAEVLPIAVAVIEALMFGSKGATDEK